MQERSDLEAPPEVVPRLRGDAAGKKRRYCGGADDRVGVDVGRISWVPKFAWRLHQDFLRKTSLALRDGSNLQRRLVQIVQQYLQCSGRKEF